MVHKERKMIGLKGLYLNSPKAVKILLQSVLIFFFSFFGCFLFAEELSISSLPTNGKLVQGSAEIKTLLSRMDINQQTDKVILGWDTFDIGSSAQVNFNQPSASSVALNRVQSTNPSKIYGQLTSNGQVFLQNLSLIHI